MEILLETIGVGLLGVALFITTALAFSASIFLGALLQATVMGLVNSLDFKKFSKTFKRTFAKRWASMTSDK